MELIPAIDLLKGHCVRLFQGDYDKVTEFSKEPVEQALIWEKLGAKRIHLVDLDGAKDGNGTNHETILSIAKALSIPVQVGGGIRDSKTAIKLLEAGIEKIILGTVAIENPTLVKDLSYDFPSRILVGIDAKDGYVATRGWLNKSDVKATELIKSLSSYSIAGIIYTDISKDGTLDGPNLTQLRSISIASEVPIIASGGIGSVEDLLALSSLEPLGIKSVIIGRALYDKAIDLKEAIKTLQNINLEDLKIGDTFNA